jgi:hypothetical protein
MTGRWLNRNLDSYFKARDNGKIYRPSPKPMRKKVTFFSSLRDFFSPSERYGSHENGVVVIKRQPSPATIFWRRLRAHFDKPVQVYGREDGRPVVLAAKAKTNFGKEIVHQKRDVKLQSQSQTPVVKSINE